MKQKITLIILLFSIICNAQKIKFPKENHFYNPVIKTFSVEISEPKTSNHSELIQDAIDKIHKKGGGLLKINATKNNFVYTISQEIQIKSNVHIKVSPLVVFKGDSPKVLKFFSVGKQGKGEIGNISLTSMNDDKPFTFDFTNRIAGEDRNGGTIAVALGGANNFKLANFKVLDNNTRFSSITMNLQKFSNNKYLFAKNGVIENIEATNAHYGYGVVQCQASYNILYRNLKGSGGATLRLETGAVHNAYLKDKNVKVDENYAENIYCENGQSVITLSPHTIVNGKVFINDVEAVSCETGLIIAAGFLSKKKEQRDKQGNAINGHIYGTFNAESIISNVKVVYGKNAQLRNTRRNFVPCDQRNLVSKDRNEDEESFKGPSVSGIVYFAKGGTDPNKGFYTIHTPNLKMVGFPKENKEIFTSNKFSFKDCDIKFKKEPSKITGGKKKKNKGKKKKN